MTKKIAIFPGSFDPFTKGHEDVVRRGARLFDQVIVGIGVNGTKSRYFSAELMKQCVEVTFQDLPNVTVEIFTGLTATFAREREARFLLRGLRNTTDFEYENTLAQANAQVVKGLETVFLITSPALAHINSTIVRDLHRHNAPLAAFLPYPAELLS